MTGIVSTFRKAFLMILATSLLASITLAAPAAKPYPPKLPDGKTVVTDSDPEMLVLPDFAKDKVTAKYTVAKTAPTIDFMFYPGQNGPGNPWSDWGDGSATKGKFYSAIGDHKWSAYVYEYDDATKTLKMIADVKKALNLPEGQYTPGKIHAMTTVGKDGWVYYCTHRGSEAYTSDKPGKAKKGQTAVSGREQYSYKGDWVLKTNPATGETKVVAQGPVPFEALPAGRLDPDRMIFYGGTADSVQFFALDVNTGKVLAVGEPKQGMYRYGFISKTTGKFYYQPQALGVGAGKKEGDEEGAAGDLWSYDPATNKIAQVAGVKIGLRTATDETPQGIVWTLDATGYLFKFDVKTEKATAVGVQICLGKQDTYHGTLDASPDGRYLYTLGGAHGGSSAMGTPVMQYDTKTGAIKVLCFLNPFYTKKYNYVPDSTFGSALSPDGSTMYITINGCLPTKAGEYKGSGGPNGDMGARNWYACSLMVIHIPESERQP